ncbi:MAG: hypothetical protein FD156_341 [Nitrospirae bacterium]|nr:MAG: hypothetical protein FD156_341 [Nitrospirota bacterium]
MFREILSKIGLCLQKNGLSEFDAFSDKKGFLKIFEELMKG